MTNIVTQSVPRHVAVARSVLAGVLAGEPAVDVSLAVSLALAILDDARPPYPPIERSYEGTAPGPGIEAAQHALAEALREASTVDESLRIGRAGAELAEAADLVRDPAP